MQIISASRYYCLRLLHSFGALEGSKGVNLRNEQSINETLEPGDNSVHNDDAHIVPGEQFMELVHQLMCFRMIRFKYRNMTHY